MLKNKIIGLTVGGLASLALAAPVFASVLSIQSLPGYINTNNFKLSCTSDGGSVGERLLPSGRRLIRTPILV